MKLSNATTLKPWYREPWPWLVFSGPAVVVVAACFTAWIAWSGADGLVVDDYYKRGLAVNEEIGRSQRAEALGLNGQLSYEGTGSGEAVRAVLRSKLGALTETTLRVRLVHPGRTELDRVALLARRGAGDDGAAEYVGVWQPTQAVKPGSHALWAVVLEGQGWRMDADTGGPLTAARLTAQASESGATVSFPAVARHP